MKRRPGEAASAPSGGLDPAARQAFRRHAQAYDLLCDSFPAALDAEPDVADGRNRLRHAAAHADLAVLRTRAVPVAPGRIPACGRQRTQSRAAARTRHRAQRRALRPVAAGGRRRRERSAHHGARSRDTRQGAVRPRGHRQVPRHDLRDERARRHRARLALPASACRRELLVSRLFRLPARSPERRPLHRRAVRGAAAPRRADDRAQPAHHARRRLVRRRRRRHARHRLLPLAARRPFGGPGRHGGRLRDQRADDHAPAVRSEDGRTQHRRLGPLRARARARRGRVHRRRVDRWRAAALRVQAAAGAADRRQRVARRAARLHAVAHSGAAARRADARVRHRDRRRHRAARARVALAAARGDAPAAPRPHRCADGPRQSARVRREPAQRMGARAAHRPPAVAAVRRHRSVQGLQRPLRPPGGRRRAARSRRLPRGERTPRVTAARSS